MKANQATSNPIPAKRILVMRYRFIGDTLLTIPLLEQLHQAYPEAQIDVLLAPNSGEVLNQLSFINQRLILDTSRHRYEQISSGLPATHAPESPILLNSFWQAVSTLRENHYDLAFVLKRSFSAALMAFLAGIPQRVGFNTEGRGCLLTRRINYDHNRHESLCFTDVLQQAGVPVSLSAENLAHYEFPRLFSAADEQKAGELFSPFENKENILISITSSNPAKQWPIDYWVQVIQALLENHPERQIHHIGAGSDVEIYNQLKNQLPEFLRDRLNCWCGQLSLCESLAMMSRMRLIAGVDSGTLHMGSAANIPVVALFGPMNEQKWHPLGRNVEIIQNQVSCRPCNLAPCQYKVRCMSELQPQIVIDIIESVLLRIRSGSDD